MKLGEWEPNRLLRPFGKEYEYYHVLTERPAKVYWLPKDPLLQFRYLDGLGCV